MTQRIEDLKRYVSIIDAIEATGLHFPPAKMGKWLRCLEHDSLVVNTHANTWAWYSRGAQNGVDPRGDVFDWVRFTTGCTFAEAQERVARGDFGRTPLALPDRAAAPRPPVELPPDLHLRYHRALDASARAWWYGQGIDDEMISRYFLGVCDYHDLWQQPTYVIPVIVGGKLVNIRHRLAFPPRDPRTGLETGDKYRPERAGLPVELFNSDILTPDLHGVIVVAGEKKCIVAARFGLPAVSSTAGCGHWNDEWTTRLQFCRKVFVAFDPGEGEAAVALAERIGERAWLVDLPMKPDDYLLATEAAHGHAAAAQSFRDYLRRARPHVNADVWAARNGGSQWGRKRRLP